MPTLAEARLRACKLWPYGSHAILSLVPVERPGATRPSVDCHWRLYHSPACWESRSVDESAGVIIHEVMHLLLKHHRRAARVMPDGATNRDWERWNQSTDYAVNSVLRDSNIPLWNDVLYPEQASLPPLLAAEDYYRRLTDADKQEQEQQQPDPDPDPEDDASDDDDSEPGDEPGNESDADKDSDGEGDGDGDGNGDQASDAEGNADGDGDSDSPSDNASPDDGDSSGGGSCSDGRQRSWELPAPTECDTPGLEQHEAETLIAETARRMLDKACGEVGGAMQRWAEQSLRPRINPQTALLKLVRGMVEQATGDGDYSYRRPNRRNPHADMVLPGRVLPVPRITVIVDTSGSMSERDLGMCVGLIAKVVNSLRIRDGINVVSGDTAAATVAKVFDPRKVKLAGGGGTDMGALVQTAAAAKPKPHLIVVATDGWTPWCPPVSVPVAACLTGRNHPPVPEWIRSVQLD